MKKSNNGAVSMEFAFFDMGGETKDVRNGNNQNVFKKLSISWKNTTF